MSGNPPAHPSKEFETLYALSVQAYQRGQFERAIRHADHLVGLSSEAETAVVWAVRLRLEARLWKEAVEFGGEMLKKRPSSSLSGLVGHAHEELGQFSEAERCFEVAIEGQGENPGWHYHRAASLLRLRRSFEAMHCLRKAVALAPNPNGLLQLAELELTFGSPPKALAVADRALEMDPSDPSGHTVAARALMQMGRAGDADRRWDRALARGVKQREISLLRSDALATCGEIDKAVRSLRGMIDRDPRLVPAYVQLTTIKRISPDERPIIEKMERLSADGSLGREDRIAIEYALGKAYDNLSEFETAMLHFDDANRLEFKAIERAGGFSQQGYAANMAIRRELFGQETIDRVCKGGNPSDLPIFVIGMIRSGTTLAEQILTSHPMVSGAGEQEHWINADLNLIDYPARELKEGMLRAEADRYLKLLTGFAEGTVRVVDKQPGNYILAGALHMAFPNARIIHMRRNPADTAVSIWTTRMQTSAPFVHDKANIVFAYRQYQKLMAHWSEVLPADRFLDVEYETLIGDREATTRRMLEFCGLPWSEECLYPEWNRKLVTTPSLWQVRQPVYSSSIGRWRNYKPWLGEFAQLLER